MNDEPQQVSVPMLNVAVPQSISWAEARDEKGELGVQLTILTPRSTTVLSLDRVNGLKMADAVRAILSGIEIAHDFPPSTNGQHR